MQMFYEDEQVSMFAPDSCAGKTCPAHSPAGSKREMTSGSFWRKHSELVYQEFMFLKITLGDGDILGQPYWEILSPYVGESSTLNTGVCPQSRKRIFLVADLGAPSSAQILFEPESLPGHSP